MTIDSMHSCSGDSDWDRRQVIRHCTLIRYVTPSTLTIDAGVVHNTRASISCRGGILEHSSRCSPTTTFQPERSQRERMDGRWLWDALWIFTIGNNATILLMGRYNRWLGFIVDLVQLQCIPSSADLEIRCGIRVGSTSKELSNAIDRPA